MARASCLVCAAAALCAFLAGCSSDGQLAVRALFVSEPAKDFEVGGSLQAVSVSLQDKMTRLGLTVTQSHEGDNIRLRSQTAGGSRFSLVLTQQQTAQGQTVRGRIEWEEGRDDTMHTQLVALAMGFAAVK